RAKISPQLLAAWERGEAADFLLIFREKADWGFPRRGETKTERAYRVFGALQRNAERSQAYARQLLREQDASANSLYVVNAIAVQGADLRLAQMLAALPEVSRLAPDPWVQFDGPVHEPLGPDDLAAVHPRSGIEWGLEKINAPTAWAAGFRGQGITVGGADTGYEWGHPAIKPAYRGWNAAGGTADHRYNWHDAIHSVSPLNGDTLNPCGFNARTPCDDNNHGTHTMGTMTGDDGMGNQIGVAPGAKWVACRNMERGWGKPSSYLECFQWFLAPTDLDGQNPAPQMAPHVINNSWYCSFEEGCTDVSVNEMLREAVIALKASGVFVVVSNGNFGPSCGSTSGPPAYFEESFSVGSTRFNDTISGFSSRGPVLIDTSYR
ncbi:MAG TPA: S8 family serine peptidase, partial [Saprospiraceae bacterium]|nr:S8 family serine peptidase [Saprospiraceae bacterium]